MKQISGEHLCKVLEKHGWELKRDRGSYHIFAQANNRTILTVPVHGNKPLKIGTLRRLLGDARLTEKNL